MSRDETKSVSSQGSTAAVGQRGSGNQLSKGQKILYGFLFPLYPLEKHSHASMQLIFWFLNFLMLVTLGFFRINHGTEQQTTLSYSLNFINLTSVGLIIGKNEVFVAVGFLIIIGGCITLHGVCALLYKEIVTTQAWVIYEMRWLVSLIIRELFIPIVSTAITSFDCYSETSIGDDGQNIKTVIWRGDITLKCLTNAYQILSLLLSIIMVLVLIVYSIINVLFIFNHNPKNGGLFSKSNGKYETLQLIFVVLIVLSMRLLYSWQFWRGVVTVGLSLILVIIIFLYVPYYSFASNYLSGIPWLVFASVRLCGEIGYAVEEATHSFVPQILFLISIEDGYQQMMDNH
ncbi:MAG: hypothetical protein EZS28_021140 [Streblomastix strix]|uniref:Uncharacterized protein n=1 Tax=Streblomastix strix TaxID=222440 RepID=A0A5J4VL64_9EUKA|nr:MAG: hypothetical protein EZS28_021140 [Streblomastix strix]